jgi:hypothetical protein
MNLTKYLLIFMLSLISLAATCERDTKLTIESGTPPKFIMSGSGSLTLLRVHGPKVREGQGETAHIIWEVVPKGGASNAKGVEEIGTVIYGQVPTGYVQNYPDQGQAPLLGEGEEYDIWLITANANGVKRYFIIHDGKIQEK